MENEINKILTFAVISDEFSGKDSYKNLIKLINKNDSYQELGKENSINEISDLLEYKGIKLEVKENVKPRKLKEEEFEELKKLIKNYNSDHFLVNRIKRFINLRDENQSNLFFNNDRDKISISVEGNYPFEKYPVREDEKEEVKAFFEKYPSLSPFDVNNFEQELIIASKKVAEVYKDFFSHFVLSKGLNDIQVEMLNEECINMQEMNKRIRDKLTIKRTVEQVDIHEITANKISVKISDIVKTSLEISNDLKNNKSKKNTYK